MDGQSCGSWYTFGRPRRPQAQCLHNTRTTLKEIHHCHFHRLLSPFILASTCNVLRVVKNRRAFVQSISHPQHSISQQCRDRITLLSVWTSIWKEGLTRVSSLDKLRQLSVSDERYVWPFGVSLSTIVVVFFVGSCSRLTL